MRRVVSGIRTRDDSIHLTLAFVGDVDSDGSLNCWRRRPG